MDRRGDPKVSLAFADLAQVLGRPMTKSAADSYARAVRDLPGPDVVVFLEDWFATSKTNRLPLPAEIRAALRPEGETLDDEVLGREVAARILGGVKRLGYITGPRKEAEVYEYLGPLAWAVVERAFGRWNNLCESLHDDQIPAYTAQIRDLTKSVLVLARAGKLNQAPALPTATDTKLKELAAHTVKQLEAKKNP